MDDHDVYERSLTLRRSLRQGLQRASAVTACSRFVLDDAEHRFGLAPNAGTVVPNGVELDERATPEALDLPFERFVLGVGRIVHKKGFDLLIEAFERIIDRHDDIGLVIGGDGPQRSELERAVRAAGLEQRVAFTGWLRRGQLAWAMSSAELFVLPSRVEPFGIVVLEALRSACPVIVSTKGGATEIVRDGVDGLLANPLDAQCLSEALACVLEKKTLAARLRDAGPRRAADFDWRRITARYRELYDEITIQPTDGGWM